MLPIQHGCVQQAVHGKNGQKDPDTCGTAHLGLSGDAILHAQGHQARRRQNCQTALGTNMKLGLQVDQLAVSDGEEALSASTELRLSMDEPLRSTVLYWTSGLPVCQTVMHR